MHGQARSDEPSDKVMEKLAERLQKLRQDKGLTLNDLAKLSGVSRSMVSQVERGASSPTVATLLNLTQALGVDFSTLVDGAKPAPDPIQLTPAKSIPVIEEYGKGCKLRILSPPDQADRHEVYDVTIAGGGEMDSEPHRQGCQEHIYVLEGAVTLQVEGDRRRLETGDAALYGADVRHCLSAHNGAARFMLIMRMPGSS